METRITHRQRVNLTISKSLLEEAKKLNLNLSSEAEAGLEIAVKRAREAQWLKDNHKAIEAYNRRIEKQGTLLTPLWMRD
jgi:antitoxin CcdA